MTGDNCRACSGSGQAVAKIVAKIPHAELGCGCSGAFTATAQGIGFGILNASAVATMSSIYLLRDGRGGMRTSRRWTSSAAVAAALPLRAALVGVAEEAAAPPTVESMMSAYSGLRLGLDIGKHEVACSPDFATHPSCIGGSCAPGATGKAARGYSVASDYRPEKVAS
jgi:hypothetical protein